MKVGSASIDTFTSWNQLVLSKTTACATRCMLTDMPFAATGSNGAAVSVSVDAVTVLILYRPASAPPRMSNQLPEVKPSASQLPPSLRTMLLPAATLTVRASVVPTFAQTMRFAGALAV